MVRELLTNILGRTFDWVRGIGWHFWHIAKAAATGPNISNLSHQHFLPHQYPSLVVTLLQIKPPLVIEQRTCWSAEVKGCTAYTPGQPRVCACLTELCNCQVEGGPSQIDKECPKWTDMQSTASDSRHRIHIKGIPVNMIALHCTFLLAYILSAPTHVSWVSR